MRALDLLQIPNFPHGTPSALRRDLQQHDGPCMRYIRSVIKAALESVAAAINGGRSIKAPHIKSLTPEERAAIENLYRRHNVPVTGPSLSG